MLNSKTKEGLKERRYNEYIDSAIKVFEQKGYHNTRVKDITEEAGTSVGNFYRYFDSKEKIFELVIDQFYNLMLKELKKLQDIDVPPVSVVEDLISSYLKIFKKKRKIALIFIEQMGGINKQFKTKKNEYQENFAKEVEKIIQKLVDLKVTRIQNVEVTARVWTSSLLEIFRWWIRTDFELNEQELVENITNFLVFGTMQKKSKK
ncbi:MAG: TetR/AcrR family transcriptional regulator [Promethearchaeota archaeon]